MTGTIRAGLAWLLVAAAPRMSVAQIARLDIGETARRNAFYVELWGAGGLYSLNIDRRFGAHGVGRIGFTSWDIENFDNEHRQVNGVILGVGRLVDVGPIFEGEGRWGEIGLNAVVGHHLYEYADVREGQGSFAMLVPNAGLRYQRLDGRWMYRVHLTSYVSLLGSRHAYPGRPAPAVGAGIAAGYVF